MVESLERVGSLEPNLSCGRGVGSIAGRVRLEETGLMGEDGIANCGNAQNCVKACPMNIPLTRAIYEENRETVVHGLLGWLKG